MADVATAPEPLARRRPAKQRLGSHLVPKVQRNVAAWGFLIGAVLCFSFFSWYPIVPRSHHELPEADLRGRLRMGGLV